jgi:hypothetical protein
MSVEASSEVRRLHGSMEVGVACPPPSGLAEAPADAAVDGTGVVTIAVAVSVASATGDDAADGEGVALVVQAPSTRARPRIEIQRIFRFTGIPFIGYGG